MKSIEEARLAVAHGASAVGLVSEMPSGPGMIPWDRIREIAAEVPPPIATFLLTCSTDAEEIIEQQRRTGTNTLQLCDRLERGSYTDLRRALPGIALVQVVHVTGQESLREAREVAGEVGALLLDSGNKTQTIKEFGGTGRTHDWTISAAICRQVARPVFLAGGLKPENVAEAVVTVRPFGLDLCTGVRTDGTLDEAKLERFFRQIPRCGS
jgi:phosphoribosylanthranilate isomerase